MTIIPPTSPTAPKRAYTPTEPTNPGGKTDDSLLSNIALILSNIGLTSCKFSSIAFRKKNGRVNPFLSKLARVNKLFRDVVMERCEQELSEEEIGSFFVKEATEGNSDGIRFLTRCEKFNEVSASGQNGLGDALGAAAFGGHVNVIEDLKSC